ncbi:hypothetical protein V8E36_005562 [Tilletia maclaganii]
MDRDPYEFVRLSDVSLDLCVRISSLQGRLPRLSRVQLLLDDPSAKEWGVHQVKEEDGEMPDLYVECQLWSDNKPLSIPFRTSHKVLGSSLQWKEWITIPIRLCDLPVNAQLVFTVHDSAAAGKTHVIGGTTFRLFGKKGTLKKAQQRLYLWPGVPADPMMESTTPSKVAGMSDEMGRLEKLVKRQERGDLDTVDWLDKLAFRHIERIHNAEAAASNALFLYIDLPRFDLPVVFCEQEALPPILPSLHHPGQGPGTAPASAAAYTQAYGTTNSALTTTTTTAAAAAAAAAAHHAQGSSAGYPAAGSQAGTTGAGAASAGGSTGTSNAAPGTGAKQSTIDASLFTIADPEIARENPVEAKHRRLVRSHRSGPLDRELKPNAAVRDELNAILAYPPTRVLLPEEMDRIWSFRFYLTRDPKGLTKFLKSVVWSDPGEAKQATEVLLPMWSEPAIDDGLELLGPTFRDPRVRSYAVRLLERAGDEELMLYLLQLVQALKFDNLASLSSSASAAGRTGTVSAGRSGTLRAAAGPSGSTATILPSGGNSSASLDPAGPSSSRAGAERDGEPLGLTDFLISRASKNEELGNNFFWYLRVECEDKILGKLFRRIKAKFVEKLKESERGTTMLSVIKRQETLLAILTQRARELRMSKDQRPKKIEKLRAFLADGANNGLSEVFDPPLILPLDPSIKVTGITVDKCSVFKSNLFPLLLQFEQNTASDGLLTPVREGELGPETDVLVPRTYGIIMKNGDDLRQDQLVIQLFTLMDKLLRNENLDLKITPYRVLATGPLDGIAQYVPSSTIAAIMAQYGGSLLNFLRHHHPDDTSLGTFGVKPAVLDTFVRSCAGYCVVTYLLGVGDRHLDNLLLAPDGHFFHVDFGYILNRDPKPFPPPVKVCKEMVDGMGGTGSPHYARFKSLCHTAFSSLRKSANLILNLVALMVDANVPDIKIEPDKAVLKVQEKFRLDLTEDEAIKHFEGLLNDTSYLAAMFDRLHDVAQYFRQ